MVIHNNKRRKVISTIGTRESTVNSEITYTQVSTASNFGNIGHESLQKPPYMGIHTEQNVGDELSRIKVALLQAPHIKLVPP